MRTREILAAALAELLPSTVKIIDYPDTIDEPSADITAVMVIVRTRLEPGPAAYGPKLQSFTLWLIDPHTDPETAEDALDDSLDLVIAALDHPDQDWLIWQGSDRDVFGDQQYPAYRTTIQLVHPNNESE